MNTLTNLSVADPMVHKKFTDMGEAFGYALPKALFGFAIVFAVLILIWGILSLMKVFMYTIPTAKKNAAQKKTKTEKNEVVSEVSDSFSGVVSVQDSNASIAAAIIAAVSAFRAANGESVNGFRVVSFKKRK